MIGYSSCNRDDRAAFYFLGADLADPNFARKTKIKIVLYSVGSSTSTVTTGTGKNDTSESL